MAASALTSRFLGRFSTKPSRCRCFRQLLRLRLMPKCQETNWWTTSQFQLVSSMPDLAGGSSTDALSAACCASLRAGGMYFILRLTQLIVRPDSRLGVLRYKIAPKCLLSGPFGHSGVGENPGVAGTVSSYNLVFTYPCQSGLFTATKMPESRALSKFSDQCQSLPTLVSPRGVVRR